jgi:hypothetical protein
MNGTKISAVRLDNLLNGDAATADPAMAQLRATAIVPGTELDAGALSTTRLMLGEFEDARAALARGDEATFLSSLLGSAIAFQVASQEMGLRLADIEAALRVAFREAQ